MRPWSVLGTGALALLVGADARAQEAAAPSAPLVARPHGELAAIGGYLTPPVRLGTTPFGAGGGARIGYSFPGVYLGGRLLGFLGGTDVDVTQRSVLYGGELGYNLRADVSATGAFVFRPQVGVGGLTVFRTDPSGSSSSSTTSGTTTRRGRSVDTVSGASGSSGGDTTGVTAFYVEPAVGVSYAGESVFAGAMAGMLFVPSMQDGGTTPSQWLAWSFTGQLGFMF